MTRLRHVTLDNYRGGRSGEAFMLQPPDRAGALASMAVKLASGRHAQGEHRDEVMALKVSQAIIGPPFLHTPVGRIHCISTSAAA